MKLRVNNLGPIKQGEIDLSKRFSVFVGYNNSGKTYMSQVVWSLMNFWNKKKDTDILIFGGRLLFTPGTRNELFSVDFKNNETSTFGEVEIPKPAGVIFALPNKQNSTPSCVLK